MPTSSNAAIRTRIDSFLAELSELVRLAALGSVHAVLSGEPAPGQRRGPGRPRGSGRPRKVAARVRRVVSPAGKRLRRSAGDLEQIAARVLAHVKANPGQRLEQIGRALKVDTAILKRPIQNLLAARKLRTKGQKRGTMYFAGGGGGGARKAGRKAKARRPAKRARKAKVRGRRPVKRARKVTRKSVARRATRRTVRRAPAHKKKAARKPSRRARVSPARAVATELAMDAAAMSSAMP
jgi:hypothetical protein